MDVKIILEIHVKSFCESFRQHTMKMINFKKKKMKLSTNKQKESYENAKICYICQEKFKDKYAKDKKFLFKDLYLYL